MARFPSREWCLEVVRLAQEDPEAAEAGSGWVGDVVVVFLPEQPVLPHGFAVRVRPEGGRIVEVQVIEALDTVDELGAAYVVKALYSVWKGLLTGTVDPVEAVLLRQLSFSGDLSPILARVGHKGWIARTFARVATEYADEVDTAPT